MVFSPSAGQRKVTPMKTPTISDLVQYWIDARNNVSKLRERLNEAQEDFLRKEMELGRHIAPKDMIPGEVICVWVRLNRNTERLIEVKMPKSGVYSINWRPR